MSANIFGDDDDDFVLPPGGDDSSKRKPAPTAKDSTPRPSGRVPSLPRRNSTLPAPGSPKATGVSRPPLPSRKQGVSVRQANSSASPTEKKSSLPAPSLPTSPVGKLPPRRATPSAPASTLPVKPAPAPTPVPAPAPQQVQYTEPEPIYEVPEPTPAPQPVYEVPEPQPVTHYEPEPVSQHPQQRYEPEPDLSYRDSGYAEQQFPRQRIDEIRRDAESNRSRFGDEPVTDLDHMTSSRRSYNEAFDDGDSPRSQRVSEESTSSSKKKKKTPAQAKKEANKGKEKKPSKYAGSRKGVLAVRIGASLAVVALMAQGVNSIVNPPQFPSQTAFMQVVNENLGITEFPIDNGNAFVTAFIKEYMNFTPETSTDRRERLKTYATDNLVSVLSAGNANTSQKISDGPIIVGAEAKDDQNAVYTVSVKIAENWVYLDVPVFYDKEELAFVVSGTPAFTAPPVKATPPKYNRGFEIDAKLATEITPNVSSFFEAWGKSDPEGLSRYTTSDADTETLKGLQGTAVFSKLDKLEVEAKSQEDPTATTREAVVSVVWSSPVDSNITFTQNYDLNLYQQPDGRWYVADIFGGVPQK